MLAPGGAGESHLRLEWCENSIPVARRAQRRATLERFPDLPILDGVEWQGERYHSPFDIECMIASIFAMMVEESLAHDYRTITH